MKIIIFILITSVFIASCYDKNEAKIKIEKYYISLKFDTLFNNLKTYKLEYDSLQKNHKKYKKILKDSLENNFYLSKIDTNEIVKLTDENSFSIEIQNIDSIDDLPYQLRKVYKRYINKKWEDKHFKNKQSSQSLLLKMNIAKMYKYIIIYTNIDHTSPTCLYNDSFLSGHIFGKITIINGYDNTLILEAYNYASNSTYVNYLSNEDKDSYLRDDLYSNYSTNIENNLKQFGISSIF